MSIPVSALDNLADLKTPPDEIQWRAGQKQHAGACDKPCNLPHAQLAYVDARYVMGVLDSLVGPANWRRLHAMDGQKVSCGIGILVDFGDRVEWVDKWDGAGETDIEGEKGSFSDSFKRAAVSWNIARDLYAMKPGQGTARQAAPVAQPQRAADAPQVTRQQVESMSTQFTAEEVATIVGDEGGTCPFHNKAWTDGKYGWYCQSKASNGSPENKNGYCNAKPSKAWAAAHEQ